MTLSNYSTVQNETSKRFEPDIDGQLSAIEYTLKKSTHQIFLIHTEVARQIQGSGIGNKIVKESLDLIDPSKQALFKQ